jgi:hypothetical protein
MKKDTIVPFEARPAVRPEERGQRAVDRQVAEVVEICKAMKSGEGLEELFVKWLGRIRVDPDAERPTPAELVYRVSDANDGVVFATPERARYVDGLFDALDSKTWGEFRSRIPAGEWEELASMLEEVPAEDAPFDVACVPGFCDGDWPPWLQKEILRVLPPPLVKKYAEAVMSCINGVYFHIKQEDLPALLAELERRGIRAVHAPGLQFD